MKLRAIAISRNPSAINRYQDTGTIPGIEDKPEEVKDNTAPLDGKEDPSDDFSDDSFEETTDNTFESGIPNDMGNRLPTGGNSGNARPTDSKVRKFQVGKISPMY